VSVVTAASLGIIARAIKSAQVERLLRVGGGVLDVSSTPAFLMVLDARQNEASLEAKSLTLLESVRLLLSGVVDRVR